ncbi:hypothetical protein BH11PAT4_BH11PAT4_7390 [soil metagenome]
MAGTDYARASRDRAVGIKAAQLADAIRDILAGPIQQRCPGFIVSVTAVTLSEDKQRANVWIRTYPAEQTQDCLKTLRKAHGALQRELTRGLPRRAVPSIDLRQDTSVEAQNELSSLLG